MTTEQDYIAARTKPLFGMKAITKETTAIATALGNVLKD